MVIVSYRLEGSNNQPYWKPTLLGEQELVHDDVVGIDLVRGEFLH